MTYRDNTGAFDELGFAPHVAGLKEKRELATTVLGQEISLPVIISPTGVQAVHPDGEVAVARAAAARGTAMGLSSFASKPLSEVVAANPRTFFQIYWMGTRESMVRRLERAREGGVVGLIGLTRLLHSGGVQLTEVNRPDHAAGRSQGKTDSVDAEAAARRSGRQGAGCAEERRRPGRRDTRAARGEGVRGEDPDEAGHDPTAAVGGQAQNASGAS
nr:alpha-hydroxy-acid oxidizing protein [Frankia sp. R43]